LRISSAAFARGRVIFFHAQGKAWGPARPLLVPYIPLHPEVKELLDAGFKNVIHVEDGFEGPEFPTFKDENQHKFYRQLAKRNKIYGFGHRRHYGWQYWGLPWTYEIDPKYIYPPDLRETKK